MLAAVALGNPALRSGGQVGVVGGVVAHIRNHLVRLQHAGVQRAEARYHLENRAGGCARADGVVQHQVTVIGQNCARLVAACNQRIQVVGGVVRHGQHTRLHVQHKHHAVFCQFQRVMLPVVGGNQRAIIFQPLAGDHQILLLVADAGDVGGNRALRHGLVVHIQRQLNIVAVRRLCVGDFAHDFRPVVAFDDAAALAQGAVLRQPILHRRFNAVAADGVVVAVPFCLQRQPHRARRDLADVADDLRRQRLLGVDALCAFGDVHARQHHRLRFNLRHRLEGNVLRNRNRQGVVQVHLHFGKDSHDFEHRVLINDDAGDVAAVVAALLDVRRADFLFLFGGVDHAVAVLERYQAVLRRGVALRGHIVVGAPLAFACLQRRIGHARTEIELPFARLFAALNDIAECQLAAVAFDNFQRVNN